MYDDLRVIIVDRKVAFTEYFTRPKVVTNLRVALEIALYLIVMVAWLALVTATTSLLQVGLLFVLFVTSAIRRTDRLADAAYARHYEHSGQREEDDAYLERLREENAATIREIEEQVRQIQQLRA